ncbi:MAG: hypothetical protein ACYCOO_07495 [Chitinophagaceae bacterium]
MEVKIDTKDKYRVLQVKEPVLDAIMTAELLKLLPPDVEKSSLNLLLDLSEVENMPAESLEAILTVYKKWYVNKASLVITGMSKPMHDLCKRQKKFWDLMITPSREEAVEIIHMEDLERELSGNPSPPDGS